MELFSRSGGLMRSKRVYIDGLASSVVARLRKGEYGFVVKQALIWSQNRVRNPFMRLSNRLKKGLPIPSGELIYLVAGTDDVSWFLHSGAMAADSIRGILNKNHMALESFDSILDFGCGVGRVVRHWTELKQTSVCGTDYNPDLIAWCRENLPFARFQINDLVGRLDYKDQIFDFVYALSVFTHLIESQQFYWIAELTRVLKPGGFLLITTHGEYYLSRLSSVDQSRFRNGQMIIYGEGKAGSNKCVSYHPEQYVRNVLANGYVVVEYIPRGARGNPEQDIYLLKKSSNA